MSKLPFLFVGHFLLLLILRPLSSNAIAPLTLLKGGKDALILAIKTYNAIEEMRKDAVATGVERLTPGQGAALRKLDSIYVDLTDLKTDVRNWQRKEEQNEIARKIDGFMKKVMQIHHKYEDYERLRFNNSFLVNGVLIKAEPETIESFAKSAISFDINELPEIIKSLHSDFIGLGTLKDSVLSTLAYNKKADLMCIRRQSAQQFILELYRTVIDADMKGLIIKLFAFNELEKNKNAHHYEYSRITTQEQFERRIDDLRDEVKRQLVYASREVWRCDPKIHQKGITYSKMQEIFQTYAYHEMDHSNKLCQQECKQYSLRPFTPECKTGFCKKHSERKRCHGKLKGCQKIHKTQKYCFAPESSDKRYEWMFTGSNTSYGSYDISCEDTIDVDENPGVTYVLTTFGQIPVYSDCDTCLCTCVSEEQNIDRHFSLKPVFADVEKNMVVTGIRFIKNDHVISLQIQQGRLGPNGLVDQDSLQWKNESDTSLEGVFTVNEQLNNVFLDDILYPSENKEPKSEERNDFVVSGVKLEEIDYSLRLKVSFVPFDFKSGNISKLASSRRFYGNDKPKNKRSLLSLAESADPTKTYANLLDSEHQQRVEFQLSGLEQDLGQSTIPFIDIQEVATYPAVPLVGLGLMHKGTKGYGGFLGLKLIQFDYTQYL